MTGRNTAKSRYQALPLRWSTLQTTSRYMAIKRETKTWKWPMSILVPTPKTTSSKLSCESKTSDYKKCLSHQCPVKFWRASSQRVKLNSSHFSFLGWMIKYTEVWHFPYESKTTVFWMEWVTIVIYQWIIVSEKHQMAHVVPSCIQTAHLFLFFSAWTYVLRVKTSVKQ